MPKSSAVKVFEKVGYTYLGWYEPPDWEATKVLVHPDRVDEFKILGGAEVFPDKSLSLDQIRMFIDGPKGESVNQLCWFDGFVGKPPHGGGGPDPDPGPGGRPR